ncbi:beta-glucuronidase [Tomitella gaofuii]|uniref:beta-glucuronidase n=1 Tax=Tomitella gaofuii TaxID=2760083 RepID=UPI0015F8D016|nr:beta-glucuronidase [Tomitella gaofuii]
MLTPQNSATRELVNLDGLWAFAVDTDRVGFDEQWWTRPLQTTLEAPVPASYNDLFVDPRIRDHVGWVWYQRTVRVPRGWNGQQIIVRVDSAMHEGIVYVDGTQVAHHDTGGYTPFEADVTEHATAGTELRLTIAVNNELSNVTIPPGEVTVDARGRRKQKYYHDFYNYAGLARSVWLASRPQTHVADVTVTTGYEGMTGSVDVDTQLSGDGADVRLTLRDAEGEVVARADGAHARLTIDDVTLWQPGAAYLYELTVEAHDGGGLVDEYTLPVGVRTVEVRGAEFLINGEPFRFTGFGRHEDTPVRGKGHDNAYLVHDFQLMEWMGANSFRTSHYPYAEEVMDFADRHGIVVIDEVAAVGLNLGVASGLFGTEAKRTFSPEYINDETQAVHKEHIRELIARDKNHPSVVMWSIANEPGSHEDGSREYFEPLVTLTRELDPTRPVTFVNMMLAVAGQDRISDLFDVLCLNRYYGWYVDTGDLEAAEAGLEQELSQWQEMYGKPMIMTEYGADTMQGMHSVWDTPWTEEYQVALLDMFHRVHDRIPAMIGEHVWNFADFQTSAGIIRVDGNKKGVFTRDRKPKAAAHALRRRWTGGPA